MKLCFLSSILTPHQAKLCAALNDNISMDANFWFYETPNKSRGSFWNVEQSDKCRVLPGTIKLGGRYMNLRIWKRLNILNPDVLMLGGFSIPGNYLAYLWARKNNRRCVIFSERSRNSKGILRKRGTIWRLLKWAYRDVDLVMVNAQDTLEQFREEFKFGKKAIVGRYAADIDEYFDHELRNFDNPVRIIFANRLTGIYDPKLAIEIFQEFQIHHPDAQLLMNGRGEMRAQCEEIIERLGLESEIGFLDDIHSWQQLGKIYSRCDIMILPAIFSNGNYTIVEALASGMGVVISDKVMGVSDILQHEKTGFICARDKSLFVKYMQQFVNNSNLYHQIAIRGREMVKPLGTKGTANFLTELLHKHFSEFINQ